MMFVVKPYSCVGIKYNFISDIGISNHNGIVALGAVLFGYISHLL